MSNNQPVPGAPRQAIRVRLRAELSNQRAEAQHEQGLIALATALLIVQNGSSLAWTFRAVADECLVFDITPLPEQAVADNDLWAMVSALRNQPQVAAAEPFFANAPSATPP